MSPDAIARELLRQTGYPAVPVGRRVVGPGQAAWDAALAGIGLTAGECVPIIHATRYRFLVATQAARANLRRVMATPPRRPADWRERVDSFMADVVLHGDVQPLGTIGRALARVPLVVAEHVVRSVVFITVGWQSGAWTANVALPADRLPLVCAQWDDDGATIRHECAHAWYDATYPPMPATAIPWGALHIARLKHAGAGTAEHDAADAAERHREARARLAAMVWTSGPGSGA